MEKNCDQTKLIFQVQNYRLASIIGREVVRQFVALYASIAIMVALKCLRVCIIRHVLHFKKPKQVQYVDHYLT